MKKITKEKEYKNYAKFLVTVVIFLSIIILCLFTILNSPNFKKSDKQVKENVIIEESNIDTLDPQLPLLETNISTEEVKNSQEVAIVSNLISKQAEPIECPLIGFGETRTTQCGNDKYRIYTTPDNPDFEYLKSPTMYVAKISDFPDDQGYFDNIRKFIASPESIDYTNQESLFEFYDVYPSYDALNIWKNRDGGGFSPSTYLQSESIINNNDSVKSISSFTLIEEGSFVSIYTIVNDEYFVLLESNTIADEENNDEILAETNKIKDECRAQNSTSLSTCEIPKYSNSQILNKYLDDKSDELIDIFKPEIERL